MQMQIKTGPSDVGTGEPCRWVGLGGGRASAGQRTLAALRCTARRCVGGGGWMLEVKTCSLIADTPVSAWGASLTSFSGDYFPFTRRRASLETDIFLLSSLHIARRWFVLFFA